LKISKGQSNFLKDHSRNFHLKKQLLPLRNMTSLEKFLRLNNIGLNAITITSQKLQVWPNITWRLNSWLIVLLLELQRKKKLSH